MSDPAALLAQSVVQEFGGKVRFVEENYGDSERAARLGVRRYPAIFVDDVIVATPKDFGFYGKGEGEGEGRYAPLKSEKSHTRFRADLSRVISLLLSGRTSEAQALSVPADSGELAALPNVSVTDLDGKTLTSSELAGRVVLVDFWATWCPPCRGTLAWLGKVKEKYGDRVAVLALAIESDEAEVRKLAASVNLPLRWAMRTPEVLRAFGDVSAVPTLFVFDQRGKAAGAFFGSTPKIHEEADARLAALLPAASAQERGLLYPDPPADAVTVARDVRYGSAAGADLLMDVYRPSKASEPLPALVFFNTGQRSTAFYSGWGRVAASKGVIGVSPDLHNGSQQQEFTALIAHLVEHARDYGIDPNRIAVYAGSGNVWTAFPIVEDPAQKSVRAAVMYYGSAKLTEFRHDIPVLYVRAGLDRPGVNREIGELAALAVSQNAPVTLLNHSTGHHAFELVDDDEATRDLIDRTLEFVKRATAASYQSALRGGMPEAMAAGHVASGEYREAASIYARLAAARPDDARLGLAYGEALLGDTQYAAACSQFGPLKGKGLGPRDLGLPAARACLQAGNADAAIEWLRTIPQRFLPGDVEQEPVFAPLRARADFRALFAR